MSATSIISDLRALTLAMLDCYHTLTGSAFPADPTGAACRGGCGSFPLLDCAESRQLPPFEWH